MILISDLKIIFLNIGFLKPFLQKLYQTIIPSFFFFFAKSIFLYCHFDALKF